MFANDTNITVSGCTFAELKQATNSELTNLYSWLRARDSHMEWTRMLVGNFEFNP